MASLRARARTNDLGPGLPSDRPTFRRGRLNVPHVAVFANDSELCLFRLAGEFDFEPLQTLETIVACRRGHPMEKASEWRQLLDCQWVMNLSPGSQHGNLVDYLRRSRQSLPTRIIRTNTFGVSWNLMTRSDALSRVRPGCSSQSPMGSRRAACHC